MTDKEYRGKGLNRWLIEKVLEDWKDKYELEKNLFKENKLMFALLSHT